VVSGAYVQSKVNYGLGKTAAALGDAYQQYRPAAPLAPIGSGSLIGAINAQFAADPALAFAHPSQYGKPAWYGVFDPTNVRAGDYLVGILGTFFAADIERFTSLMCIWCNRTISVIRAVAPQTPGASTAYGGETSANEQTILSGWPASVLQLSSGSKMVNVGMRIPTDSGAGGYSILLPSLAGTPVRWNDIIVDDEGTRYSVAGNELSPLGWRLTATQWPT